MADWPLIMWSLSSSSDAATTPRAIARPTTATPRTAIRIRVGVNVVALHGGEAGPHANHTTQVVLPPSVWTLLHRQGMADR
jgi:hypothetical protein